MGHHCINHCSCARCDSGFNRAESDDVNKEKLNLLSPYSNKVDVYSITYPSDNLKIKGFLVQPKDIADKHYPLLVYNRGGNREHGMIRAKTLQYLSYWASKGYVVVATQYREMAEVKEQRRTAVKILTTY